MEGVSVRGKMASYWTIPGIFMRRRLKGEKAQVKKRDGGNSKAPSLGHSTFSGKIGLAGRQNNRKTGKGATQNVVKSPCQERKEEGGHVRAS